MSKQYLMVLNETGVRRMMAMIGDDSAYLEVQSMAIDGNDSHVLLATPITKQEPVDESAAG